MFEQQLDYDSRVVQRRLYQKSLLEIALPPLLSKMDSKYKTVSETHRWPEAACLRLSHCTQYKSDAWLLFVQELQQFEQYIFSDYSSFILVHNVYDDILRTICQKEVDRGKPTHMQAHLLPLVTRPVLSTQPMQQINSNPWFAVQSQSVTYISSCNMSLLKVQTCH